MILMIMNWSSTKYTHIYMYIYMYIVIKKRAKNKRLMGHLPYKIAMLIELLESLLSHL